jgi:hypothetical protein
MNMKLPRKNFFRRAQIFAALSAGIFLVPMLRAQPTEATVQNRFLLVFDTSSDMKKRVPAVQKALNELLATSVSGQLHEGDSIGVWTFDQNLHPGEFPLQSWNPDNAAQIAADINKFVGRHRYAKTSGLGALQPLLNQVVENSERLTVLVFCDGESPMGGTPFDDGVNQLLQQRQAEQKRALEPIVILLRSQLGRYAGCTVSFPPEPVNLPPFPPLPQPPPPPKLTNAAPPPPPQPVGEPIILIGKKVENNPPPPVTNSPPTNEPAAPVNPTNRPAAPPTNPAVAAIIAIAPAPPPENPGSGEKKFLLVGTGLLGAAVALGTVVWLRSRRKDSSLITRSMNERR